VGIPLTRQLVTFSSRGIPRAPCVIAGDGYRVSLGTQVISARARGGGDHSLTVLRPPRSAVRV
jgi:hypothetical protein